MLRVTAADRRGLFGFMALLRKIVAPSATIRRLNYEMSLSENGKEPAPNTLDSLRKLNICLVPPLCLPDDSSPYSLGPRPYQTDEPARTSAA